MRAMTRTLAILLCSVAVLVGGLSGLGAPASAGPAYEIPAVGSCYAYSYQGLQKSSDTSPAVPCALPHTAVTVAVLRVKGADFDQAVGGRGLTRCFEAIRAVVGGEPVRTAYSLGFFFPTKAQVRKGARW